VRFLALWGATIRVASQRLLGVLVDHAAEPVAAEDVTDGRWVSLEFEVDAVDARAATTAAYVVLMALIRDELANLDRLPVPPLLDRDG
jgi:hypothetical protein